MDTDAEKVLHILVLLKVGDSIETANFKYERIGKPRSDSPRLLKVNVTSKVIRNSILEKARVLRINPEPWRNIYIKKDLHPVYRKENQRIQKKIRELKQNDTANSEIKISDGALTVNGEVVDHNSFFI